MSAETDRADLEQTRAHAGSTPVPHQDLGRLLAAHLADEVPDIDPQTRARVALHIGKMIAQVSAGAHDKSGSTWGNVVLIAAVNQDQS